MSKFRPNESKIEFCTQVKQVNESSLEIFWRTFYFVTLVDNFTLTPTYFNNFYGIS